MKKIVHQFNNYISDNEKLRKTSIIFCLLALVCSAKELVIVFAKSSMVYKNQQTVGEIREILSAGNQIRYYGVLVFLSVAIVNTIRVQKNIIQKRNKKHQSKH